MFASAESPKARRYCSTTNCGFTERIRSETLRVSFCEPSAWVAAKAYCASVRWLWSWS
jgi:hypothetical protein